MGFAGISRLGRATVMALCLVLAAAGAASAGSLVPMTLKRGRQVARLAAANHVPQEVPDPAAGRAVSSCRRPDRYHVVCQVDYSWADGGACTTQVRVWQNRRSLYQSWTGCPVP